MSISLDGAVALHAQALALRGERARILAHNIANADTPGYRARDFDFARHMGREGAVPLRPTATHPGHLGGAGRSGLELGYRRPLQPSLDQNTVETPVEQAAFMDNSVKYLATLTLMSGRIQGLLTAITGQ